MSERWWNDLDVLDKVEGALTSSQREFLHEARGVFGVDVDGWLEVPTFRRLFTRVAAFNLLARARARGLSEGRSLTVVGRELGIPRETIRDWTRVHEFPGGGELPHPQAAGDRVDSERHPDPPLQELVK